MLKDVKDKSLLSEQEKACCNTRFLSVCSILSKIMPLKDILKLLYSICAVVLSFVLLRQIEIRHIHFFLSCDSFQFKTCQWKGKMR